MLTDEFKKELIKGPFTMMPKLMEKIYFNEKYPENHTIKMVNKNKDLMKLTEQARLSRENPAAAKRLREQANAA